MLAFCFRSLTFQPPLASQKRFYLSLEVKNDSSQTTEIFTYYPQTNRASLSETLEFLVKDPEKSSSFTLELYEFDNPCQRHMKIGKETVLLRNITSHTPSEVTLPTLYGTDAVVDLTVELSEDFRESSSDGETSEAAPQKKRRHLEKLFNKNRFKFFKLKAMTHESVFGLTPVVQTLEILLEFIKWKNPHRTFGVSMLLTLLILHGQTLLGLGFLLYFVFYKRIMPILLEPSVPDIIQQGKLQAYKKNFIFVRETTEKVSQLYEIYKKLFLDADRTFMIECLLLIRKFSPVCFVALLTLNIRFMIVAGYWTLLIYNTKPGRELIKRAYEEGHICLSRFEVFCARFLQSDTRRPSLPPPTPIPTTTTTTTTTTMITRTSEKPMNLVKAELSTYPESRTSLCDDSRSSVGQVIEETRTSLSELPMLIPKRGTKLFKEKSFLTFENQRWWPGKGWRPELLPGERPVWSDDLGQIELKKDNFKVPGPEWHWEGEWNIVMSSKTDDEGWEYASRFKKFEDPNRKKSLIHSVRRRKWIRKCIELDD